MIQFIFRNVLVKGGDLPNCSDAVDVLFDGMLNKSSDYCKPMASTYHLEIHVIYDLTL